MKTGKNYNVVDVLSQDVIVKTENLTCLQMTSLFGTFNFSSSLYAMTWAGFLIDSVVVFNLVTDIPPSRNAKQANFSIIVLNTGKLKS